MSGSLPEGIGFAGSPHVVDAQTHLLGTKGDPNAGVFRTTDAGATWSLVRPGGVVGGPARHRRHDLVADRGRRRVPSDGATWTEMPSGGAIYTYAISLIGQPR